MEAALLGCHLVLTVVGYGVVRAASPGDERPISGRGLLLGTGLLFLAWLPALMGLGLLQGGLLGLTSTMAAASTWAMVGPFLRRRGEERP